MQPIVARALLMAAESLAASNKALAQELYGVLSAPTMPGAVRLSAIRAKA